MLWLLHVDAIQLDMCHVATISMLCKQIFLSNKIFKVFDLSSKIWFHYNKSLLIGEKACTSKINSQKVGKRLSSKILSPKFPRNS